MNKPFLCTITGVGQQTNLEKLISLSKRYPFAEWGVLVSYNKAGSQPKYPSLDWIARFIELKKQHGLNASLHLCGRSVMEFAASYNNASHFLRPLVNEFDRVQVNFRFDPEKHNQQFFSRLQELMKLYTIITQHNKSNMMVRDMIQSWNHHVLFDSSGGNGVLQTKWQPALPDKAVYGYAGGLGPDNVTEQLDLISEASNGFPYWIDMEGRVRDDNDQLDLVKVESVLQQVDNFRMRLNSMERYFADA